MQQLLIYIYMYQDVVILGVGVVYKGTLSCECRPFYFDILFKNLLLKGLSHEMDFGF